MLIAGVTLAAIWPRLRLTLANRPASRMIDLAVYRTAGQSVLHGRPVYSAVTQPWHLPFTYPPISAVLAVPLALTTWRADQLIWVAVICGSLVVCIRASYRPLLPAAGRYATVAGAALFVACVYLEPMRDELQFGQIDIVLLALCVSDCLAAKPRWPRGMLVGLATAVKLFPGVFIIYLLVSGRVAAARTAAVSAAGWTALGFVMLPGDSAAYWAHQVFDTSRIGSGSATSDQSLHGLVLHLSGGAVVPAALWLGAALVVAILGLACARQMSRHGHETAAVAAVALLGALLSPISWIHEYVVIIVAIGAIAGSGRSRLRLTAAAVTALLFTLPVPHWGTRWLGSHGIPAVLAELARSADGVLALLIIAFLWVAYLRPAAAQDSMAAQPHQPEPDGPAWAAL